MAEIVTDIRLHGRKSKYCTEAYEKEIDIAGHALMYEKIFSAKDTQKISIYTLLSLNSNLYSCAPAPEFGGRIRQTNTLVTGGKFDTIDYTEIPKALEALDSEVDEIIKIKETVALSEYIRRLSMLHHKLTVVHPFGDGNGRTTRAFYNILLMQKGIYPIYIKADEKERYINALSRADKDNNYDDLCIVFLKALLRSQAELTEAPLL